MKKLLLLLSCAALFASCTWFGGHQAGSALTVINVLDPDLYADCHIKGSINIPFDQVEARLGDLNKDAQIVVYCSNYKCTASAHVVRMLKARGFAKVFAYEAGMAGWYQAQLPIEGPAKSSYLTMDNAPLETATDVPVISTQELKEKMGLVSAQK